MVGTGCLTKEIRSDRDCETGGSPCFFNPMGSFFPYGKPLRITYQRDRKMPHKRLGRADEVFKFDGIRTDRIKCEFFV